MIALRHFGSISQYMIETIRQRPSAPIDGMKMCELCVTKGITDVNYVDHTDGITYVRLDQQSLGARRQYFHSLTHEEFRWWWNNHQRLNGVQIVESIPLEENQGWEFYRSISWKSSDQSLVDWVREGF